MSWFEKKAPKQVSTTQGSDVSGAALDFLVEIGTEELPAKTLSVLAQSFCDGIKNGLIQAELTYQAISWYATPRRLCVIVTALTTVQPTRHILRLGPNKQAAFNQQGEPSHAALGFARSCGIELTEIAFKATEQGERLYFEQDQPGAPTSTLLAPIVNEALKKLPIPKPMRWGNSDTQFIRPVQWVVMLLGSEVIADSIMGLIPTQKSYGHRFHHPNPITIKEPATYTAQLLEAKVVADFNQRRESIREQIQVCTHNIGTPVIDDALLDEVTGLVEWPVALLGKFDPKFLVVPAEALISSMQVHQKSFAVRDDKGQLLPHFITISNIESSNKATVIVGNERVIRARLSDAEFFFQEDIKHHLEPFVEKLKSVVFQAKLGSLFEKTTRNKLLAHLIAKEIKADPAQTERAALLSKADLMTQMVGEFPELQGIMGYYYALLAKEPTPVALAIREHYCPRFAGDTLPNTLEGCALSLADKLDTLVGIFGVNQGPTGDKDPFGLRRAALGILRIAIEKKLSLDLRQLVTAAIGHYHVKLPNENVLNDTLNFILERLRTWYSTQGITTDIFAAVHARFPTNPLDFDWRIKAVQHFKTLPEAKSLAAANKRVSNILKNQPDNHAQPNPTLFENAAETNLAALMASKQTEVTALYQSGDYQRALTALATLQTPIDQFFDQVHVMAEDPNLRDNRLLLLSQLRNMFLQIADISLLSE
jgi:glycyl-tRNA synthetase beta chain